VTITCEPDAAAVLPPVTARVAVQSSRRLLRDTLATCLAAQPDIAVAGNVADPDELPALCELGRADTVILDAGPRLGEYAALTSALLRRFPGLNVIVIYRDAAEEDLTLACRAGVSALVPESHGLAGVLAMLRRGSALRARLSETAPNPAVGGQGGGPGGSLTDRELELVALLSSGHNVTEIAGLFRVSPVTVENLKRRVYAKLGVNSSAQAVSRAASLGLLGQRAAAPPRPAASSDDFPVLAIVAGQPGPAVNQVVTALISGDLPFVLVRRRGPVADAHWAQWHRGPSLVVLVDPEPADWSLVDELAIPAIVVHSRQLDSQEIARALASGANALVPGNRIGDHFLAVLRMVSQGYLVVSSLPMRSLIGVVRAKSGRRNTDSGELPELTARESDILHSVARGYSVQQTARALEISPKTVENTQTRLFRKLEVRNRAEALAVADALGLLPDAAPGARPASPAEMPRDREPQLA
jgi:two-component system nitrate/nitrite response regulator NarL